MRALGRRVVDFHYTSRISGIDFQSLECTRLGFTSQCEERGASVNRCCDTRHSGIVDVKKSKLVLKGNGVMGTSRTLCCEGLDRRRDQGNSKAAAAALKRCAMMNRFVKVWECWVISATKFIYCLKATCCFFSFQINGCCPIWCVLLTFNFFVVDRHFVICHLCNPNDAVSVRLAASDRCLANGLNDRFVDPWPISSSSSFSLPPPVDWYDCLCCRYVPPERFIACKTISKSLCSQNSYFSQIFISWCTFKKMHFVLSKMHLYFHSRFVSISDF